MKLFLIIFLQIFTIILSSFSALGVLHTKYILELLRYDIEVEQERQNEYDSPVYSSNEAKLHASEDAVLSKTIQNRFHLLFLIFLLNFSNTKYIVNLFVDVMGPIGGHSFTNWWRLLEEALLYTSLADHQLTNVRANDLFDNLFQWCESILFKSQNWFR